MKILLCVGDISDLEFTAIGQRNGGAEELEFLLRRAGGR
jgi:hypothetical protein